MRQRLPHRDPRPVVFWSCVAAGAAVMAFGVRGVFADSDLTHPLDLAKWFIGSLIVHDFIFAPVVIALGLVVARIVPRTFRRTVQPALIISGIVVLIAVPLLRGYGERRFNPTHLPRNYAAGVLVVLAAVWIVAVGLGLLRMRRATPRRRTSASPPRS